MGRTHEIVSRSHEIMIRSHEIMNRSHELMSRSHEIILDTLLGPLLYYGIGIGFAVLLCMLPLLCWWLRSLTYKARDCLCLKRLARASGVDKFDDFELMMLVHEVQFTSSTIKARFDNRVRVTAGLHTAETDLTTNAVFQQTFLLTVEQGTREVCVDFLDGFNRKLAVLRLDPLKDILSHKKKGGVQEKSFTMQAKGRGVSNARILLTMRLDTAADEERGLLAEETGLLAAAQAERPKTAEQQFALRQHLAKVGWDDGLAACEQLEPLARACAGPVECLSGWAKTPGYLAVKRPPERRRFIVGLWKDQADCESAAVGSFEVDLMRVSAVQVDPGRPESFVISYVDSSRLRHKLILRRLDRGTEVWVEMLTLLISVVRDLKHSRGRAATGEERSPREHSRSISESPSKKAAGRAGRDSDGTVKGPVSWSRGGPA